MVPPSPDPASLRVAVLRAGWHPEVVEGLWEGAREALARLGVDPARVLLVEVPGSFELPQAAAAVARAGLADAIVALGCVVRGETPHAGVVASACAHGLEQAALLTGVPVGFGVITADTLEQARARAGAARGKGGNKGAEAAEAAVGLARTLGALGAGGRP